MPAEIHLPLRLRAALLLVLVACGAALLVRAALLDAYRIPSASMEPTLLPGDLVLVEKWTLGARGPGPFSGSRLPGVGSLDRGDVVVFGQPMELRPLAQKTPFVKRVVGLPGDTVEIRAGVLHVNGEPYSPALSLLDWTVTTTRVVPADSLRAWGCAYPFCTPRERMRVRRWRISATPAEASGLRAAPGVEQVRQAASASRSLFPLGRPQTLDAYGPVALPRAGAVVEFTEHNWPYVRLLLERHEGRPAHRDSHGRFWVDGELATRATLHEDYVFVLGDHRHGSVDSRHFGPVPTDHLIGRVAAVAFSWDENGAARWSRAAEIVR